MGGNIFMGYILDLLKGRECENWALTTIDILILSLMFFTMDAMWLGAQNPCCLIPSYGGLQLGIVSENKPFTH